MFKSFKDSKGNKMGVHGVSKYGTPMTLLNPYGKGRKYATELKHGKRLTNDFKRKRDESGKQMSLSVKQKSYRAGYLQARKDSAACYKAIKAKKAGK